MANIKYAIMMKGLYEFIILLLLIFTLPTCNSILNSDGSDKYKALKKGLKQAKINSLRIEISLSEGDYRDSLETELEKINKKPWRNIKIPKPDTINIYKES